MNEYNERCTDWHSAALKTVFVKHQVTAGTHYFISYTQHVGPNWNIMREITISKEGKHPSTILVYRIFNVEHMHAASST